MSKPNNPPAFPISVSISGEAGVYTSVEHQPGMTLRDYFAAKAMQSMIAKSEVHSHETRKEGAECWLRKAIAVGAFQYADAMLEERAKQ